MRPLHRLSCLLLCVFALSAAQASQLVPIAAKELEGLSDVVLVGTVKTVARDEDNTIPEQITDFDIVTAEVSFVLKGTLQQAQVTVRLATRGNRAFDPTLAVGDSATFFLKRGADSMYHTAYPGSVAIFPRDYFTTSTERDSEQQR